MLKHKVQNKPRSLTRRHNLWRWVFISPWVIGITVFFLRPMVESFVYSVSRLTVSERGFEKQFVGLDNYIYFFMKDSFFVPYLVESLGSILPSVLIIVAFSTLIAIVLKEKFFGRTLARAVFFFPLIIASGVVITILKNQVMMSTSNVSDLMPSYIFKAPNLVEIFGKFRIPDQVLVSITNILNKIFDLTWKSGVQMLLILAAVNNIPASFYEVSEMEGATAWEKFWKITVPTISPTILVVVIYTIIDTFTDYGNKVMQLFRSYYTNNNYACSATIGIIYGVCILVVIGLVELLSRKFIYYAND